MHSFVLGQVCWRKAFEGGRGSEKKEGRLRQAGSLIRKATFPAQCNCTHIERSLFAPYYHITLKRLSEAGKASLRLLLLLVNVCEDDGQWDLHTLPGKDDRQTWEQNLIDKSARTEDELSPPRQRAAGRLSRARSPEPQAPKRAKLIHILQATNSSAFFLSAISYTTCHCRCQNSTELLWFKSCQDFSRISNQVFPSDLFDFALLYFLKKWHRHFPNWMLYFPEVCFGDFVQSVAQCCGVAKIFVVNKCLTGRLSDWQAHSCTFFGHLKPIRSIFYV